MNENCEYWEECRHKDNLLKFSRCENNPINFQKIEDDDKKESCFKNPRRFYIFRDNFEEI